MTDFRYLLTIYVHAHETGNSVPPHIDSEARSALAQPETEPQGLTDEELLALMPESMRDEFSYAAKVSSDATGGQVKPGIFRVCLNHSALEYARAVLARWGK
jgi:hypothetical protein